ncbi:MAG: hypothetical protein HC945_00560 [Nitrosarchaeum sp.]|nr:hypothetical protein [Nitrosarchaeum sp.]
MAAPTYEKALAFGTAVSLILILAGVLVLAALLTSLVPLFSQDQRHICSITLAAQTQTKIGPVMPSPIPAECKRIYLDFTSDGYEKYYYSNPGFIGKLTGSTGKKALEEEAVASLTQEIIYREIAEETVACWNQMLAGEQRVFPDEYIDWLNNNRACFICAEIHFSENKGVYTDYLTYLKTTPMPKSDQTYHEGFIQAWDKMGQEYLDIIAKRCKDDPDWCRFIDGSYALYEVYAGGFLRLGRHSGSGADVYWTMPIDTAQKQYIVFLREGGDPDKKNAEGRYQDVTYWAGIVPEERLLSTTDGLCEKLI